jgi:hypothetical protein
MSQINSHLDLFAATGFLVGIPTNGEAIDQSVCLIIDTLAISTQSGLSGTTAIGTNGSKWAEITDQTTLAGVGTFSTKIIENLFAHNRHPEKCYLLSVDLVGGDTIESMILAFEAVKKFYAVLPASTTQTFIADCVDGILQSGIVQRHIVIAGIASTADATADNSTWVAGTLGVQTAAEKLRCWVSFHNANGTDADFADYAGSILAVDPSEKSPSGNVVLVNTAKLAALATQTAKTNLRANNLNFALPLFNSDTYIDAGVMLDGTPIYHVLTFDYMESRFQTAMAKVKYELALENEKLEMSPTGQSMVLSELQGEVDRMIGAKHLLSPEEAKALGLAPVVLRPETITTGDLAARQMRFTVRQYIKSDARSLATTFYLSAA